jgi:hypothetical protein
MHTRSIRAALLLPAPPRDVPVGDVASPQDGARGRWRAPCHQWERLGMTNEDGTYIFIIIGPITSKPSIEIKDDQ